MVYNLYANKGIWGISDFEDVSDDLGISAKSDQDAINQALDLLHELDLTDDDIVSAIIDQDIKLTKITEINLV